MSSTVVVFDVSTTVKFWEVRKSAMAQGSVPFSGLVFMRGMSSSSLQSSPFLHDGAASRSQFDPPSPRNCTHTHTCSHHRKHSCTHATTHDLQ